MAITFSEISRMTLFRGFDPNFVKMLDLFFFEQNYEPNVHLIERGQFQDRFFIIVAGEVEAYQTVDGKKISLNLISAGQFFGEINLLDPGQATASIISLTPVKTLEITNKQFLQFIANKPELAADFTLQLATTIVKRFRDSNDTFLQELSKPENIYKAEQINRGMPA